MDKEPISINSGYVFEGTIFDRETWMPYVIVRLGRSTRVRVYLTTEILKNFIDSGNDDRIFLLRAVRSIFDRTAIYEKDLPIRTFKFKEMFI